MQDLAISARVTWRRLALVDSGTAGWQKIPVSPLRVALAITSDDSTGIPSVRLEPATTAAPLNMTSDLINGGWYLRSTITVGDLPGVFNQDLFTDVSAVGGGVYEAVMDSDLSKSVQRANEAITQEVR